MLFIEERIELLLTIFTVVIIIGLLFTQRIRQSLSLKKNREINPVSQWFLNILIWGVSVVALLASSLQFNYFHLLTEYSPKIWSVSLILLIPIFLVSYGLLGYFWGNFILIIGFSFIAFANSIKISTRTDSVVPADLSLRQLQTVASSMLNGNQKVLVFSGLIFILFLFFGAAFISWKFKSSFVKKSIKSRAVMGMGGLLFLFGISNNSEVLFKNAGIENNLFSAQANLKENGTLIHFISRLNSSLMVKPEGYSKEKVESLVKKIQRDNLPIKEGENKPNVIFMLSEAFWDPTKLSNVSWKEDPIPNIRKLIQSNGGNFLSPEFGGATANVEYNVITGFSSNFIQSGAVPYVALANGAQSPYSIVENFNQWGYNTLSLHPYEKSFYNREELFKKFGFNRSIFKDQMTYTATNDLGLYVSDQSLMKEIEKIDKEEKKPYFLHTISMQNHYGYTSDLKYGSSTFTNEKLPQEGIEELNNYARGLHATDKAIQELMDYYSKQDEETLLVFYGDHLPALKDSLLNDGLIRNKESLEAMRHKTEYFIWSNKKELKTQGDVSANYLAETVLTRAGMPRTDFQLFLENLRKSLPEFGYNFDVTNLDSETQEKLETYEMLQYDMLQGKQYAKSIFEEKRR